MFQNIINIFTEAGEISTSFKVINMFEVTLITDIILCQNPSTSLVTI